MDNREFAVLGNQATLSTRFFHIQGWEPKGHFKTSADRLVLFSSTILYKIQVSYLFVSSQFYVLIIVNTPLFFSFVSKPGSQICCIDLLAHSYRSLSGHKESYFGTGWLLLGALPLILSFPQSFYSNTMI